MKKIIIFLLAVSLLALPAFAAEKYLRVDDYIPASPPQAGGSGDMTKAVYDAGDDGSADTANALKANGANAAAGNAILGVDASGAAEGAFDVWTEAENTAAGYISGSSPTITTPALTLEDGNGAAPTADGRLKYDRTTERLQVGDGATTKEFYSGAHTVVDDTPSDGNTTEAASSNSVYDHINGSLHAWVVGATSVLTLNTPIVLDEATGNEYAVNMSFTCNKATSGDCYGGYMDITDTTSPGAIYPFYWSKGGSLVAAIKEDGILLPLSNDAVTPTIAFGDGDTGFYESADDSLVISRGGVASWEIFADGLRGFITGGVFLGTSSSGTVPSVGFVGDQNTGIGRPAADQISITAGGIEIKRYTEDVYTAEQTMALDNTHGGYIERTFAATSGTLTGATDTIELNIPSGWVIKQCQLHVKVAVTDTTGDDTWSSELNDGAQEEVISAASAAAQNTNVNHFAHADAGYGGTLTDAETDILLTPQGGEFSSGEIEAHCLATGFDAWDAD